MSITEEVTTVARQAIFTGLGAADLAITSVGKRLERISADALSGYAQAQSATRSRMLKAQDEAVHRLSDARERIGVGFDSTKSLRTTDPVALRKQAEKYVGVARGVVDLLATRGHDRADELRSSRAATMLLGSAQVTAEAPVQTPAAPRGSAEATKDKAPDEF